MISVVCPHNNTHLVRAIQGLSSSDHFFLNIDHFGLHPKIQYLPLTRFHLFHLFKNPHHLEDHFHPAVEFLDYLRHSFPMINIHLPR
jgi:hypothetical protein